MTRLFDEYDASTCSVCHRHPSLGWLYRCTQDSDGFLPKSDFSDDTPAKTRKMKMDPSLRHLSPPVMKAINEGQYTDEQVQELVRQKESVREAIQDDTRPTTSSSTTDESTTFSAIPESTTFSTNNTSAASLDEELRAAYDWHTLHKVWQAEATRQESEERQVLTTDTDLGPPVSGCGFKICATCRPTYRERAFQSLDEVLKNPKFPPPWELDNRRVSGARIVMNIGLTKPKRFYAQTHGQEIESQHTTISQYPSSHDEAQLESESAEETPSKRHSRSGFRETVRNALKRARSDQPLSFDKEDGDKPASDSNTESPTPFRRSMIFLRRKSRPSMHFGNRSSTKVVDNESLQNSLNLMLASNTPLPPSGPTTPKYPPTQQMCDSDEKRNDRRFDDGAIISHA